MSKYLPHLTRGAVQVGTVALGLVLGVVILNYLSGGASSDATAPGVAV